MEDEPDKSLVWARWATQHFAWGTKEVHPKAWKTLGYVLLDHGRYREAEKIFRRLDPVAKNPDLRIPSWHGGAKELICCLPFGSPFMAMSPSGMAPEHWMGCLMSNALVYG